MKRGTPEPTSDSEVYKVQTVLGPVHDPMSLSRSRPKFRTKVVTDQQPGNLQ